MNGYKNGVIEPCSSAYARSPSSPQKRRQSTSLTGYFRKFIPAYSVIAKPLSDLLRKDTPFNFDVKQKASFDELKRLLCQKPVLVQEVLNSTFQRSINTTPFELLFGTQINNKTDLRIQQLIDEQLQLEFNENRKLLRKAAKTQILKVQNENKKSYNLRRKSPYLYSVKDLVAIKKTQPGPGQKHYNKFIGPYKITQVKPNDTYNAEKCGNFDGPTKTSTCAEYLKPWPNK
ncbi:transposon Ty3-I Gag-Pol polyprotein [Trichonephila clavipes]|uniref:Transposon Ty3-I Gag-Pol polyprotein n=1 Tax=Trichonephila clavipes TaxID=2585209 RepID=A0A8X6T5B2_TRICX|nr:transposon Ty3-I Gag-Pol polyprotein [Trichonephila clavipes]